MWTGVDEGEREGSKFTENMQALFISGNGGKSWKNDGKCFFFHRKNSFCCQDE